MATALDREDIQGLVARGYGSLPAARYLLLRVVDPAAARSALGPDATRVYVGFRCAAGAGAGGS